MLFAAELLEQHRPAGLEAHVLSLLSRADPGRTQQTFYYDTLIDKVLETNRRNQNAADHMYFESLDNFEEFIRSLHSLSLGAQTQAKFQSRKKAIEIQSLDASARKSRSPGIRAMVPTVKFLRYLRHMQTLLYAEYQVDLDECRREGRMGELIQRALKDGRKELVNFLRRDVIGGEQVAERSKHSVLNQMVDLMTKRQMATRVVLDAKELKYFLDILDLGFLEGVKEDILEQNFANITKHHFKEKQREDAKKTQSPGQEGKASKGVNSRQTPPSKQTPIIEFTDSEGSKNGGNSERKGKGARDQIMEILSRSHIMKGPTDGPDKVNQSTEVRPNVEHSEDAERLKGHRSLGDPMVSDIANMYRELMSYQKKTDVIVEAYEESRGLAKGDDKRKRAEKEGKAVDGERDGGEAEAEGGQEGTGLEIEEEGTKHAPDSGREKITAEAQKEPVKNGNQMNFETTNSIVSKQHNCNTAEQRETTKDS